MARKTKRSKGIAPTHPKSRPTSKVEALVNAFRMRTEEIEVALASGAHQGLLEDYFGEQQYAELRQLARASLRATRGGPKVLILPGIMGSTLGIPRSILDDVVWIDPFDVLVGRLSELKLGGGGNRAIAALGVVPFTYTRLKLRLRAAGFDAEHHPFDWRQESWRSARRWRERSAKAGVRSISSRTAWAGSLRARQRCDHRGISAGSSRSARRTSGPTRRSRHFAGSRDRLQGGDARCHGRRQ